MRVGREGFCTYKVRFYLKHGRVYGFTLIEVTGNQDKPLMNGTGGQYEGTRLDGA